MSFEDLLKYFYSININMVRHPGLNSKPWTESRKQFYLEYNPLDTLSSDKRVTVPTFVMNVTKPGSFIVSIHQQDNRVQDAMPYIDIGVSVLKVDPVYRTCTIIQGTGNTLERQNQTNEFDLDVGRYLVIPTSTGCKLSTQLAEQEAKNDKNASKEPVPLCKRGPNGEFIDFTEETYAAYEDLFHRINLDSGGYLSKEELDQYMERTEGSPVDEQAYQWLMHNFESVERKGLTMLGFSKAQLFVFKQTGADEEKLRNEFRMLGYDDNLRYYSGRALILVVHSTGKFDMEVHAYDDAAFNEAMKLPIIEQGSCNIFEEGKIKLYKLKSGYSGVSFVVENKHYLPLVFVLDCSTSVNVCSHRGDLKHQETIPPGESRIMHHLMPLDGEGKGWKWSYSASYMWDK